MSNVDKIRAAEENVAAMQDTLTSIQTGLESAEEIAVATEEARHSREHVAKLAIGVLAVALLVLIFRRRRRSAVVTIEA